MSTTTQSAQTTLQQQRALSAWKQIEEVRSKGHFSEYLSLVRGFPASIQRDGIGPSLAFLASKGKNEHRDLQNHLSQWVLLRFKQKPADDLLEWLIKQDSNTYRRATTETLAYLTWLKRFAEAKDKQKD